MISRRSFLPALAATGLISGSARAYSNTPSAHVVIIGGGFAGLSAARILRNYVRVSIIEPNPIYTACPFSNLVIAGERSLSAQQFTYDNFSDELIQDSITSIDAEQKKIALSRGKDVNYDKVILAPGISFDWRAIEGYDREASKIMPHAWKGGSQTKRFKDQLTAMPDGGTVIISVPPPPFRCPPGPYERASLIAHYLKTHKPRSKILILDFQDKFSKQALFEEGWAKLYGNMIERIPGSESGQVTQVDSNNMTVSTDFDTFKGDVINIIPPQKAGKIALKSGAANGSGWCPIDATTFESTLIPDIHIIGDATIATPMPKSAFSASLQGRICGLQIAMMLSDQKPMGTTLSNTCYSYLAPDHAFSVSGVYHNKDSIFSAVKGAGGTSPAGDFPALRQAEALQAEDWFNTITKATFG